MKKEIFDLFNEELFDNKTINTKGAKAFKSLLDTTADVFYLNSRFANTAQEKIVNEKTLSSNITDFLAKYDVLINENPEIAVALFLMNLDIKHGKGERTSSFLMARALSQNKETKALLEKALPAVLKLSGWRMIFGLYSLTSQPGLTDNDYRNKPAVSSSALFPLTMSHILDNDDALLYKWIWNPNSLDVLKRYGLNRFLHDVNSLGVKFNKQDYAKWRAQARKDSALNLIETNLTNKTYDNINIAQVPKRAQKLHLEWFKTHLSDKYADFIDSLDKQDKTVHTVTVAEAFHGFASAYDNKDKRYYANLFFNAVKELTMARNLIAVIDVSGSMDSPVPGSSVRNIDVSIGLGLALALKNKGKFKNAVFTFSGKANLVALPDVDKMSGADETDRQVAWLQKSIDLVNQDVYYGTTNLMAIFELLIKVGTKSKKALPDGLVVLSDGEFDPHHAKSAIEGAKAHFKQAGLDLPTIISWNLNSYQSKQALPFTAKDGIYFMSGYNINLFNMFTKLDFKDPDLDNVRLLRDALKPYVDEIRAAKIPVISDDTVVSYFKSVKQELSKPKAVAKKHKHRHL